MQCLVLAGGLGTRMKTIAGDKPKALLPIGPHTFVDWQLQWLKRLGATEVVLALAFKADEFRSHVEASRARNPQLYPQLSYSYDGPGSNAGVFLGTGGAVRQAAETLGLDDDFVVTYGDSFLFLSLERLMAEHKRAGRAVTFSIYRNAGRGDTSNVVVSGGRVVKYSKTDLVPEMDHIDYGMFAVRKSYLLSETKAGPFDLAPFIGRACDSGELQAVLASERFREIGSPAGYDDLRALFAENGHDLARLERLVTR